MTKKTVVSGLQPSGTLHIGNYLGMIKNALDLQENDSYEKFFFLADYHSLTSKYDVPQKRKDILGLAVDLLASGIDPKKSTLFIQSHIPEHTSLAWILNTITSVGELERMVEYKEKVKRGQVPNVGLFTYPVLQAADILIYKANLVPVGEDQRQHLELTRTIARAFNNRFGRTFPEPKALSTRAPRVMSLADPKSKMSKSVGKGCLFLTDPPKEIKAKIMSAQTDSLRGISYDPGRRPGVSNLVLIYSEFSNLPTAKVVKQFEGQGYAEFKKALAELLIENLTPIQKRRKTLLKEKEKVLKTLDTGAKKAHSISAPNFQEIQKKVGLI